MVLHPFPHKIEIAAASHGRRKSASLASDPMNPTRICPAIVLMSLFSLSSTAQISVIPPSPSAATIEGVVIKDPSSESVKKAIIELIAEDQQQGGNYTAVSATDGTFHLEGVAPGRYHLFAERTGYVESKNRGGRSEGRILTLTSGQHLKDVQIRFAAAATVTGRVTDEDGDPLENAEVAILRRTFVSGRGRLQQVGAERTNDLGEYRVANLPAGNYYISVNPPPDFKSLIDSESSSSDKKNPGRNNERPSTSYQTTYYPGTSDRSQAEPIQLHPGDEFPANFSLTPNPTLVIRGSVANLPPGTSATIVLQSNDFNIVFNGAEVHKDGSFIIRDVAPGAYTVLASVDNAPVPMIARQSLQLASNNLDGIRLVPQTGATIRGTLHLEGRTEIQFSHRMSLVLHSPDGEDDVAAEFGSESGFSPVAEVAPDGNFQWANVPPGDYSIRLGAEGNGTSDWFVKSAVAGGHAADPSAIPVDGGTMTLDLIASAKGGVIEGIVIDPQGHPVADAVIVAAPETSLRSHSDRFRKTVSDQNGHFSLHGIPPGQYSLFAWDNVDGDAFYDPDFLKNYEPQANLLRIMEGDRKSVQLQVITTSK